jgi:hypothetical protein
MSRQQMYDFLGNRLGYTEKPPGSNCNDFSHILGKPCQPWCGDAQTCAEINGGFDPRKFCDNTSFTPNFYGDLKIHGWAGDLLRAQLMDPVFFKFGSRIDHVGGFVRLDGNYVITIDGNTGDGGAKEWSGGTLAVKRRLRTLVAGCIHLPVGNDPSVASAEQTMRDLANAIKFSKAFTIGVDGRTPQTPDGVVPKAVMSFLQTGLNRWMDKFAFMAKIPNPDDIAITGVYDDPTKFCVGALRNIMGFDKIAPSGWVDAWVWNSVFP